MSPLPRSTSRRGFTLIEILATLAVLAVGLASVIALVLGSSRMSVGAVDKNTATLIISEAIEDISRIHLITKEQLNPPSPLAGGTHDKEIGLYIETLKTGDDGPVSGEPWPNIQDGAYAGTVFVSGTHLLDEYKNLNISAMNTMVWPPLNDPKYYGGPLKAGGTVPTGTPFRVIYRLERHSDWIASLPPVTTPAVPTAFEGIYVLTLAVYKDLEPAQPVSNPNHKYEQMTDPVVVYLRRKS